MLRRAVAPLVVRRVGSRLALVVRPLLVAPPVAVALVSTAVVAAPLGRRLACCSQTGAQLGLAVAGAGAAAAAVRWMQVAHREGGSTAEMEVQWAGD
jgi:hypothetical protein